jgi:hypothetical protein
MSHLAVSSRAACSTLSMPAFVLLCTIADIGPMDMTAAPALAELRLPTRGN